MLTQKRLDVKTKIWVQHGCKLQIEALCVPCFGGPDHVPAIGELKISKRFTNLNRYISVTTANHKKKVCAFRLAMFIYPDLCNSFSIISFCFVVYFSTAKDSNFDWLLILRRTGACLRLGVPRWKILFQTGPPKFKDFNNLKGVEHAANFTGLQQLKLKWYSFWIFFVFISGLPLERYSTQTKTYLPKKVLETQILFYQPELPGKKRDWIILTLPVTSRDQSNFGKPLLLGEIYSMFDEKA